MNLTELNALQANGKTSKFYQEKQVITCSEETGEIICNVNTKVGIGLKEPNYVKVYTDCMLVFNNKNITLSPYLIAFAHHLSYANAENGYRQMVSTDEFVRADVALRCGVSDARVKQAIQALIADEIFIPIEVNGKRKRGRYFVNPWVIGKGEWKDIRELRGAFEFVDAKCQVLSITEQGQQVLTTKEDKDGQLSLDFKETEEGN